jgi:flagellar biosynthetic protein FliP
VGDRETRGVPAGISGDSMDSNLLAELLKILGFMGFLVGGSVLITRMWGQKGSLNKVGKSLEVLETVSLGKTRLVCLVRAGSSKLVLGVTDNSVNLLKEMSPKDPCGTLGFALSTEEEAAEAERPESFGFSRFLSDEFRKVKKRLSGRRMMLVLAILIAFGSALLPASMCLGAPADLPIPDIDITIDGKAPEGGLGTSLGILGLLTVLSLAPAIVMLTTSFTRMVIVFSFLRSGLGTQQTPPNQVLIGLALILTFFVMAPTWTAVYDTALDPYIAGTITGQEAFNLASEPMKEFMLRETREKDLTLFATLGGREAPATPQEMSLFQVVPAFAISELRTAFEMGFMLYLPFLVIDMVVASTLMSMGMMMLPPVLISLPFKLLLFVLVDGWSLITKSLIGGFAS